MELLKQQLIMKQQLIRKYKNMKFWRTTCNTVKRIQQLLIDSIRGHKTDEVYFFQNIIGKLTILFHSHFNTCQATKKKCAFIYYPLNIDFVVWIEKYVLKLKCVLIFKMVLRMLFRYLANNEKLIQRMADSYIMRRAAQMAVAMMYRTKSLASGQRTIVMSPEKFK